MNNKIALIIIFLLVSEIFLNLGQVRPAHAAGTKTISFTESTSQNRTQTITIPNLQSVTSVTVNTGQVSHSISGNQVTLNVSGGSYTRRAYDSYYYSQYASDYDTSSIDSFSSSYYYSSGGYSGDLTKDGQSYVYNGSYTPSDSQTEYQTCENTITQWGRTNPFIKGGSSHSNSCPSSFYYNSDGYRGVLYRTSTDEEIGDYVHGPPYYDSSTKTTRTKWELQKHYTANYSGTVNKPASDTRIYRQDYDGTIYKGGYKYYYAYSVTVTYIDNRSPTLALSTINLTRSAEIGLNLFTIAGAIQDPDGQDIKVTVSIDHVKKEQIIKNTSSTKSFSFPFDVINDEISGGIHTVTVIAEDTIGASTIKTITVTVKEKLQHDAFIIAGAPLEYPTLYMDPESDPIYAEQFKFLHSPQFFKNSEGLITDSGIWRTSSYATLALAGKYEVSYRARDNPLPHMAFDEFRKWSPASFSTINIYVHRKPVALFSVTALPSSTNYTISKIDYSFDKDHQGESGQGISQRRWEWKLASTANWTNGLLPSTLPAGNDYLVRLKVRDVDGTGGLGVWSDWNEQAFNTHNKHQSPLALFELTPLQVSHKPSAAMVLTDRSFSPSGHSINAREWRIYRLSNQALLLNAGIQPTSKQLKSGGTGKYRLELRVRDSLGLWSSQHYSQEYEVINNPPEPSFTAPDVTYRDINNSIINMTPADIDGDALTYRWWLVHGAKEYFIGTAVHPSFKIENLNLGKNAVSTNWSIKQEARDALGSVRYSTRVFQVLNRTPIASASGPTNVFKGDPYNYISRSFDYDAGDRAGLVYRWRLTAPSGHTQSWSSPNITGLVFNEKKNHLLEHWVTDPLGTRSLSYFMDIVVGNKRPSAGFNLSAYGAHNNTNITLTSTATDEDGYVDRLEYYVTSPTGEVIQYEPADSYIFTRMYAAIGAWQIKQIVTDNEGATDEISKTLQINNRLPITQITDPTSSNAVHPSVLISTAATPLFTWNYSDMDSHVQQRFHVEVYNNTTNRMIMNSGMVLSEAAQWTASPLAEDITYRVRIRTQDGYGWSIWSDWKYFRVVSNRPPAAMVDWAPNPVWEGDELKLLNHSSDPDGDKLTYDWKITAPDGSITTYKLHTPPPFVAQLGHYTIELAVSDGKETHTAVRTIAVQELKLLPEVRHAPLWLLHHESQKHNTDEVPMDFYSGEVFILQAISSPASVEEVKAWMDTTGMDGGRIYVETDLLTGNQANVFNGTLFDEVLSSLTDGLRRGTEEVIFRILYSNGVVKETAVPIQIIGNVMETTGVHRRH